MCPCVGQFVRLRLHVSVISPVSIAGLSLTFVIGASWDKDELVRFCGGQRSKVKVTLLHGGVVHHLMWPSS